MATSEAVPFAKTGGLADVCGALPVGTGPAGSRDDADPARLSPGARRGPAHRAHRRLVRSADRQQDRARQFLQEPVAQQLGGRSTWSSRTTTTTAPACTKKTARTTATIANASCSSRGPCWKACGCWICTSTSCMPTTGRPDWCPRYLKIEYRGVPRYEHLGSLFTIHNMAYQGMFWHWDMLLTGLDWKYFNWQQMEYFGNLNLLKTGLIFADRLNTVSPRYAEEIQNAPLGLRAGRGACSSAATCCRALSTASTTASGIRRPTRACRPTTTPIRSSPAKPPAKRPCKPSWACPSRPTCRWWRSSAGLTDQKGIDLLVAAVRDWVQTHDVQWVVLGTGEPKHQEQFATAGRTLPAQGRHAARVFQHAGPPHRSRRRHLRDAQPLRAVRSESALQPQVRHGAGGPRHRRPGRHGHRRQRGHAGRRHGHRFQLPRIQSVGTHRSARAGLQHLAAEGRLETAGTHRHDPGLVLVHQRPRSTSTCIARRSTRCKADW